LEAQVSGKNCFRERARIFCGSVNRCFFPVKHGGLLVPKKPFLPAGFAAVYKKFPGKQGYNSANRVGLYRAKISGGELPRLNLKFE